MYVRYAESARVAWLNNFGVHIDPSHQKDWHELATPRGTGVILKSIKVDYKFVRTLPVLLLAPIPSKSYLLLPLFEKAVCD